MTLGRRSAFVRSLVVLVGLAATAAATAPPAMAANENRSAVTIPDSGPGAPYPSTITVDKLLGTTTQVSVFLRVTHTLPDEVQLLLVGPGGQKVSLMDGKCGGDPLTSTRFTFFDSAMFTLPEGGCLSGDYRPNYEGGPSLPAPAPPAPYASSFSGFVGSPNGAWQLFANDQAAGDSGSLPTGWRLDLALTGTCSGKVASLIDDDANAADPGLNGTALPDVILGSDADDTLTGRDGNDIICAGGGDDKVVAGNGRDVVLGQGGDDELKGRADGDKLSGGSGDDDLRGEAGRDRVKGGKGDDECRGGGGPDKAKGCENEKL